MFEIAVAMPRDHLTPNTEVRAMICYIHNLCSNKTSENIAYLGKLRYKVKIPKVNLPRKVFQLRVPYQAR